MFQSGARKRLSEEEMEGRKCYILPKYAILNAGMTLYTQCTECNCMLLWLQSCILWTHTCVHAIQCHTNHMKMTLLNCGQLIREWTSWSVYRWGYLTHTATAQCTPWHCAATTIKQVTKTPQQACTRGMCHPLYVKGI